ncbi:MAG: DUF4349 domain-containing protein [Acidimicrobiales bacterium]|jgi:hypothetical protein
MITDGEFSALITEAAETIPEPTGANAILAAARVETDFPMVASPIAKVRRHPRGFAISALGAAAALAISIAVAVSLSSSPPNVASHAFPRSALGLVATPGYGGAQTSAGVTNANTATSSTSSTASESSQKIVTTGRLSLVVDESALGHVVAELQAIASSLGGYVSTSNVALAGSSRGGTVVLGVPAGEFQKAVREAESLGTLKHLSTTATDVTGQVADLGAQVSALEAARTQLEALFARAGTIPALLSVQNEITSVQSQIQQLQAQQRVLANEISFSSLTVALDTSRATHASAPGRFSKAWHEAVSHVEDGLATLVADSGIVLFSLVLFVVIGLLLLFGGRLLWSFIRRRLV